MWAVEAGECFPILAATRAKISSGVALYFYYKTPKGVVSIVQRRGRWHVLFEDSDLGSYVSAHLAAEDVAGGHTFSPPSGIDLGSLGIPKDLGEWTYGNGVASK